MPITVLKYTEEMMDGRRKLSADSKIEIRTKYESKQYSILDLSREYGVSGCKIHTIVNPGLKKIYDANQKSKGVSYYDKDKHREYIRTYRAKKRRLGFLDLKTDKRKPA